MAATIQIIVSQSSSGNAVKEAKQDVQGLGDAASKSGSGFSALKEVGVGALRALGEMALNVGAQVAQSVVSFVGDSISAAGNFEAAVNGFKAVTGGALSQAGFDFDDVTAKALQLGADTQFSSQQAIDAMTALAKGGVPVKDIMGETTDATLALASAAKLDLAQAADIVAKQLGVWGETGVTASQVTDLLASAANASVVDVDELALGLANVGGTAKTAGVSFEDLTQTMALIAPNFSSASDAGTSLKTFISRLIPTTDTATEAMAALGLATVDGKSAFFDASGSFIGMEKAAQLLQTSLAGLSEEEKLTALNTIFGSDAIRAAAAIANAGADGFNNMGQAMIDSGGAAAASAVQNQGYAFAMEQMKGSIETVQIVIGTMLLPVLTSLLNGVITPGINTVMTFAQAISQGTSPMLALRDAIQPLTGYINSFLPGFSAFANLLLTGEASAGGWARIRGMFASLFGPEIGGMIMTMVGNVMNFVASVQEGIARLQPVFSTLNVLFRDGEVSIAGWARMGNLLRSVLGEELGGAVEGAIQSIMSVIASFQSGGAASTTLGAYVSALGGIWEQLQATVTAVVNAIWPVVSAIFAQIQAFLSAHGAEIMAVIQQTWTTIGQIVELAIQLIRATVVPALEGIANFINTHGAQIQGYLSAAWTVIKNVIDVALTLIKGVLQAALQAIQGDWSGAWETIKQMCARIVADILGILQGAADMFRNATQLALDAILGVWKSFTDWTGIGGGIIDGIVRGIVSAAGELARAAAQAASDALQAAKDALGISSPSMVFAMEVGRPMGEGMAMGLMASAPMVAGAAGYTANAAVAGAQTYNQRSMVYSPTINNYGRSSDGLDYQTAVSLAGV